MTRLRASRLVVKNLKQRRGLTIFTPVNRFSAELRANYTGYFVPIKSAFFWVTLACEDLEALAKEYGSQAVHHSRRRHAASMG
jgi:hypothetical protein